MMGRGHLNRSGECFRRVPERRDDPAVAAGREKRLLALERVALERRAVFPVSTITTDMLDEVQAWARRRFDEVLAELEAEDQV